MCVCVCVLRGNVAESRVQDAVTKFLFCICIYILLYSPLLLSFPMSRASPCSCFRYADPQSLWESNIYIYIYIYRGEVGIYDTCAGDRFIRRLTRTLYLYSTYSCVLPNSYIYTLFLVSCDIARFQVLHTRSPFARWAGVSVGRVGRYIYL